MALPPLITLEEHFLASAVTNYYATLSSVIPLPESHLHVMKLLRELGQTRLSSMDSGRVSVQVISHRPNAIPIPASICSTANDELAAAIASSPDPSRFRAFAMIPTSEPEKCYQELQRCTKTHGFIGSLLDNTTDGRYYDDSSFWPIFQAHVDLNVPLYLHPAMQPDLLPLLYKGNYDPLISTFLANHGLGWHFSTALHILRLFAARVFDTFPNLRIIIGHMGEMLPFQLDRICRLAKTWPEHLRPKREFRTVLGRECKLLLLLDSYLGRPPS